VGPIPETLKKWFCAPASGFRAPVGGGRERRDVYLALRETELGIKQRGGKKGLEVKGLVDVLSTSIRFGQVSVEPQLFCKWSSAELQLDPRSPWVETVKTRWLRKFDTASDDAREIQLGAGDQAEDPIVETERPDVGCNVELTTVTMRGETWWTFGAEAFAFGKPGRTVELVGQSLLRAMRALPDPTSVDLRPAEYRSYPQWIAARVPPAA
jgi:hypothetical protein